MSSWKQACDALYGLGDFKMYFVGKCLKMSCPNVVVKLVVGSNLQPVRSSGAFNSLFLPDLAVNLSRADLISMVELVTDKIRATLMDMKFRDGRNVSDLEWQFRKSGVAQFLSCAQGRILEV